jgi:DNA-binding LacI/PurR family transcriptional regulator
MLMPIVHDELVARHERVISERYRPGRPLTQMFDGGRLVDGVLMLGNTPYPEDEIAALERLGVPVVCVGGQIESKDVWVVKGDDFGDAREAALHLSQMGHRHIAAWTQAHDPRFRGFLQGARDAGLGGPFTEVAEGDPEKAARRFAAMRPRPTALLIARHFDRVPAHLDALRECGFKPGEDLYLCSFDDDLWNNFAPLGMAFSRVEQPVREIARLAARVLMGRIEGAVTGPVHTLLRSRFVAVPPRRRPCGA